MVLTVPARADAAVPLSRRLAFALALAFASASASASVPARAATASTPGAGAGARAGTVAAAGAPDAPLAPQLWWRAPGGEVTGAAEGAAQPLPASRAPTVPLGSVWKLFVHGYLQATRAQEPPYHCAATERATDDEYCCDPGGEIARDDALAHSCGPYFAPARLHLDPAAWQRFWRAQQAPAWLGTAAAWDPATEVPLPQLLDALASVPPPSRQAARAALLPLALRLDDVVPQLGSGPRFKTWSWHRGAQRIGGAAGWLADGTPFWFGAPGTSKLAVPGHAAWIAHTLQAAGLADVGADDVQADDPCVDVALFARYPVRALTRPDGHGVPPGPLAGDYRVQFANGHVLAIQGGPGMAWRATPAGPRLSARWPLDEYVARVVDREGDGREPQAARALAVVARTWLLQNSPAGEGCHRVDDASQQQRVSPRAPSAGARAAASFTTGLVLDARPVHYHLDRADADTLSWQAAVQASRAGTRWDAILHDTWPHARLQAMDGQAACLPLPAARQWLVDAERRWRAPLRQEPGFEPLAEQLQVCQLSSGNPDSDQRLLQIHVREWLTHEGRLSLLHEYLHLAFRHHPRGQDDAYVERLARRLIDS